MDTSSITMAVQQIWTVDEQGNKAEQNSEIVSYGCAACGMGWGGWEATEQHCRTVHSPDDGEAYGGPGFNDGTSVSTFHAVELETPGE